MEKHCIAIQHSLKAAMKRMSETGGTELYVVDDQQALIGSLSDGDIRKWILSGGSIDQKVSKVCNPNPKYVREAFDLEDVKQLMIELKIESVPVLSRDDKVIRVLVWDEVFSDGHKVKKPTIKVPIVVMAGGKGSRLDPFTKILPKPLIPVGDKPVIEIILDRFGEYGVKQFYISVNHKSRMIKSYFDELDNGYSIKYLQEDKPLGTAGCLRMLENKIASSFIVANCDVIIDCNYAELLEHHINNDYDLTMVVSCRHYVIPYGVCEINKGGTLKKINEKPEYDFLINTGMYVVSSKLLKLIPKNKFYDFTDLIEKAKKRRFKIGVFPISEHAWTDIGQWDEYRNAVRKLQF